MSEALEAEVRKYTQQIAADPKSRAFVALADAYRKLGQCDEAIKVALDGLKQHPHYLAGKVCLARAYFENGDLDTSQQLLDEILRVSPDNLLATRILSEILVQKGEPDRAIPILEQLLKMEPGDARARSQLDALRRSPAPVMEKPVAPTPTVTPAPTITPPPVVHPISKAPVQTKTLGDLYLQQGHPKDALHVFEKVLSEEPADVVAQKKVEQIRAAIPAQDGRQVSVLRTLLSRIQERRRGA